MIFNIHISNIAHAQSEDSTPTHDQLLNDKKAALIEYENAKARLSQIIIRQIVERKMETSDDEDVKIEFGLCIIELSNYNSGLAVVYLSRNRGRFSEEHYKYITRQIFANCEARMLPVIAKMTPQEIEWSRVYVTERLIYAAEVMVALRESAFDRAQKSMDWFGSHERCAGALDALLVSVWHFARSAGIKWNGDQSSDAQQSTPPQSPSTSPPENPSP